MAQPAHPEASCQNQNQQQERGPGGGLRLSGPQVLLNPCDPNKFCQVDFLLVFPTASVCVWGGVFNSINLKLQWIHYGIQILFFFKVLDYFPVPLARHQRARLQFTPRIFQPVLRTPPHMLLPAQGFLLRAGENSGMPILFLFFATFV